MKNYYELKWCCIKDHFTAQKIKKKLFTTTFERI